jgi:hypothetical protein
MTRQEAVAALRVAGALGVWGISWFLLAGLRTMVVGNDEVARIVFSPLMVILLLLSTLPFVGYSLRVVAAGAVLLPAAALLVAVLWASVEETLVMNGLVAGQKVEVVTPLGIVSYQRWQPFSHHAIVRLPDGRWIGTD